MKIKQPDINNPVELSQFVQDMSLHLWNEINKHTEKQFKYRNGILIRGRIVNCLFTNVVGGLIKHYNEFNEKVESLNDKETKKIIKKKKSV